jgi:hypothetical protein
MEYDRYAFAGLAIDEYFSLDWIETLAALARGRAQRQ